MDTRSPKDWLIATGLFLVCLLVLLRTAVPTIYTFDSAELVTGAKTLGIVHAPGYPLYLVLLHIFMQLPFEDFGRAGNLFSVISLALTAPVLFYLLRALKISQWVAFATTLIFVWSYRIWLVGLFAEVYAPQILTVTILGYALVRLHAEKEVLTALPLIVGFCFGVALAVHPSSVLFAPGVVISFRLTRIPWRASIYAAVVTAVVLGIALLYFPIRYASGPTLNLAGVYGSDGVFQPVNLQTAPGLFWMLSGQQFNMFKANYIPTLAQVKEILVLFGGNYLGFGLILGAFGLYIIFRRARKVFYAWVACFVPFTYFYLVYGASDKHMMFGPSLLLWALPLAWGIQEIIDQFHVWLRVALIIGLPLVTLGVNFRLLDMHDETRVRERAESVMEAAPPDTSIFARWLDITPLEYLQLVEGKRPDLHLYNLFVFPTQNVREYIATRLDAGETVWLMTDQPENITPGCQLTPIDIEQPSLYVFEVSDENGACLP